MGFNTLSFIPFLLIVMLFYIFTIFRKCQWVLLLTSIAFYLFAGPKYIILFYFITLVHIHYSKKLHDDESRITKTESFLQGS